MVSVQSFKEIAKPVAKLALGGGAVFGVSYGFAKLMGVSAIPFASTATICAVAIHLFGKLVDHLATKYKISKFKVSLIKTSVGLVIGIASAVALLALGILNPVGLGIVIGINLISFAKSAVDAAKARRKESSIETEIEMDVFWDASQDLVEA